MKRLSTRLLMICAAIGVAGGLVYAVNAYVGGTIVAVLPIAYGAVIAVYFLPGAIAQALLHRPLVAVTTAVLAALVSAPVQPSLGRALGGALLIGALQELVFAVSRYRYWRLWVFVTSSAVAGLIVGIALHVMLNLSALPLWAQIVQIAVATLSPVAATLAGIGIARALDRAGVARGIAREARSTR